MSSPSTHGPFTPDQPLLDVPGLPGEEGVGKADLEARVDQDPEEMPNATGPEAVAHQAADSSVAASDHPEDT